MEIICPVCGEKLLFDEKRAVCSHGHSFDAAKSGYFNLSRRKNKSGDNRELIEARAQFLTSGHYQFLCDEMLRIHQETKAASLLDLACGEAYYTSQFPCERIGIDLSSSALNRAAKRDRDGRYLLASIFHLPLREESCDFVLTCFAPIAKEEIRRVLKRSGHFLLVTPARDHLYELKEKLYPQVIRNSEENIPLAGLQPIGEKKLEHKLSLNSEELHHLLYMTPYAYKTKRDALQKFAEISSLEVCFSFRLNLYRKN